MTEPAHQRDPTEGFVRFWLRALAVGLAVAAVLVSRSAPQRGILLAVLVLVAFLPFSYARRRLHRALLPLLARPGHRSPLLTWTIVACGCDAWMLAQLVASREPDPNPLLVSSPLSWIGPVWFSGHLLLLAAFAVLGTIGLITRWRRGRFDGTAPTALDHPDPSRRLFLRRASTLGVAVPFGISFSGVGTSYDFRVEPHQIQLPNWPHALDGLRVAHLSDIHVGGAMNREKLQRIAALTRAASPDLIVYTGDFLTHRAGNFDLPLYEALATIEAPLGQWACLGNHDYDDVNRLVGKLAEAGVTTLRNQTAALDVHGQTLEILGLDYLSPRHDQVAAYQRILSERGTRNNPRLVLNHDPQAFSALPEECADLVLSGHTHGGQLGVQLSPGRAVTVLSLLGLRDQGVFERGDMRLFVTRCVGFYGYPMRIGIPPEIALLTLTRRA